MSKIVLVLNIEASFTMDGGYYSGDNMDKIKELVNAKVSNMAVLIQEGAASPKPSNTANIKLSKIIYEV